MSISKKMKLQMVLHRVKKVGPMYFLLICSRKSMGIDEYRRKKLQMLDEYYSLLSTDDFNKELLLYYYYKTGEKILDIDNPGSFNEKIQWLKIYDNTLIKRYLADKFLVREFVKRTIGEKYLIRLLETWDNYQDVTLDELPKSFVIKCNHGSGFNYIVKDKEKADIEQIREKLEIWSDTPFYANLMEPQYKNIEVKIFAEEYIEQLNGDLLDYKIHCFNGKPLIIQVIGSRDTHKHTAKEAFFDSDWNRNMHMYSTYEQYEISPPKPETLDEMLEISRVLGKFFLYVRIDLYDIDGDVKFGEMTFTPMSGMGKWSDKNENYYVGDMLDLKGKNEGKAEKSTYSLNEWIDENYCN